MQRTVKCSKGIRQYIFDDQDESLIKDYTWSVHGNYMTTMMRKGRERVKVFLQRYLMGVEDKDLVVRFKDGNGFNYSRENMYVMAKSELLKEICKR